MVGSWVILSVVGIVIFLICLPAVICLYFRIEFICTRVGGSGTSRDFPTTRRQWGCRLKSEFSFFQSLSQLFLPSHFVKWRRTLLELNSPSTERETEFRRRLFTSSELGIFTSWSCKNGQRNVQKSVVHVQSWCFASKTYGLFDVLVAVRVVGSWSERPWAFKARGGGALIQRTRWLACVGFNERARGTLARRGEEAYWLFTIYKKFRKFWLRACVHRLAFLYISLQSPHDLEAKVPNFTFCGGGGRGDTRQRLSFSFPQLRYSLLVFNSTRFANMSQIKRDALSVIIKWRFRSRHRGCRVSPNLTGIGKKR